MGLGLAVISRRSPHRRRWRRPGEGIERRLIPRVALCPVQTALADPHRQPNAQDGFGCQREIGPRRHLLTDAETETLPRPCKPDRPRVKPLTPLRVRAPGKLSKGHPSFSRSTAAESQREKMPRERRVLSSQKLRPPRTVCHRVPQALPPKCKTRNGPRIRSQVPSSTGESRSPGPRDVRQSGSGRGSSENETRLATRDFHDRVPKRILGERDHGGVRRLRRDIPARMIDPPTHH